jgi:hypothetical protein
MSQACHEVTPYPRAHDPFACERPMSEGFPVALKEICFVALDPYIENNGLDLPVASSE